MCGAQIRAGYQGCLGDVARLSELVDFADQANHLTRFFSVDAMALQHSEVQAAGGMQPQDRTLCSSHVLPN
jgi:hypothetical protein